MDKQEKKRLIAKGNEFQVIGSASVYKVIESRVFIKLQSGGFEYHAKIRKECLEDHSNTMYCHRKILGKQVFSTVWYDNIQVH